ncbi:thiol reductant ABC exporter subunit CydD [Leptospira interrogans]
MSRAATISASLKTGAARDGDATPVAASLPSANSGAVLQVVASLLWIPQAALLSVAVGSMGTDNAAETVLFSAAGVLILGVVKSILDAIGARLAFRHARAFLSEQRRNAVEALASRSPIDVARPAAGHAASVLAEQAEAVVPYLSRFRPARMRVTIVPIAIWLCVFFYSWAAAVVLLFAAPLIPVFMALIGWRAKAASEAQLVELGSMNTFLLDRLRGLATIRSMQATDATAHRLRADAENLRKRTMAVLRIAFLSSAVLEFFAALGVAMVAVYVGFHLLGQLPFGAWGNTLSLSEGLFILLLAPAFFEPLRDLSAVWHDRAAGEAALDALRRLSQRGVVFPGARNNAPSSCPPETSPVAIQIEKLCFRHTPEAALVFDNFDFDVAPGEHVALLAPSGKGKSTLLAVLAGLAVAESGRVFINGQAFSEQTAARIRNQIAWIGQHPHVFPGTLAQNVTLGRADVSPAVVRQALRRAGLGDVAERRGPALVGENGLGLSGGEASRLALARVAAMPAVGLVLADEPTAHLDTATAQSIADALIAVSRGRTLIVATHDPVLAARMDRIVQLAPAVLEDAA